MRLSRYLFTMGIFLAAVVALAVWVYPRLKTAFLANPALNIVLVIVWLIGIAYIVAQTLRLSPDIRWMLAVQRNRMAANDLEPTPLMGSLARLMEDRRTPLMLTPTALRAVLDGVAVRLDESREVARYFIGLMIFLGLLGTFWGLLKTVGSVGGVVSGLSMTADPTELFTNLKTGLQGPLSGMGTAFGSSLLGLAGSLVLGFLDLQMGQAQNQFFISLEDWLFASTRGADRGLGDEATPEITLQTLIEQTAANIGHFQRIVSEAEEGRRQSAAATQTLAQRIGDLAEAQARTQDALMRAGEADTALVGLLTKLDQALAAGAQGNEAAHAHLAALQATLSTIVDEQSRLRVQGQEALARTGATDAALVRLLGELDQTLREESQGGEARRNHLAGIETTLRAMADEQARARAAEQEEVRSELRRLARTIGVTLDHQAGG